MFAIWTISVKSVIILTRPTSTTWDLSKLKNLDYPDVIEYEPKVNKRKLQELDGESQDEINACSTVSIFNKDGSYKKPQIKIDTREMTPDIIEDIGADIWVLEITLIQETWKS